MPLLRFVVTALPISLLALLVIGIVGWAAPYVFPVLLWAGIGLLTDVLAAPGAAFLGLLVVWALISVIEIPYILRARDWDRFGPPAGPRWGERHPVVSFIAAPRRPEDRPWWVRVLRGLAGYALLLAGIFLVMAVTSGPHPLFGPDRGYSPRHGCSIGSHYDGMGGCLNDPPVHHAEPLDLQLTG